MEINANKWVLIGYVWIWIFFILPGQITRMFAIFGHGHHHHLPNVGGMSGDMTHHRAPMGPVS